MRLVQKGFTLIELVVVITILGILAAFAIPRFASLDSAARVSAISGLAGSMRSASALAHAMYLASGSSSTATVTMEGVPVTLTNGYPSTAGIVSALQDTSGFTQSGTTTVIFQEAGAATPASCQVVYTPAAAGLAPTIALTASAC
jgi:MSHA pilin protein MshA